MPKHLPVTGGPPSPGDAPELPVAIRLGAQRWPRRAPHQEQHVACFAVQLKLAQQVQQERCAVDEGRKLLAADYDSQVKAFRVENSLLRVLDKVFYREGGGTDLGAMPK